MKGHAKQDREPLIVECIKESKQSTRRKALTFAIICAKLIARSKSVSTNGLFHRRIDSEQLLRRLRSSVFQGSGFMAVGGADYLQSATNIVASFLDLAKTVFPESDA